MKVIYKITAQLVLTMACGQAFAAGSKLSKNDLANIMAGKLAPVSAAPAIPAAPAPRSPVSTTEAPAIAAPATTAAVPAKAATAITADSVSLTVHGESLARTLALLPGTFTIESAGQAALLVHADIKELNLDEALTRILSPIGLTFIRNNQYIAITEQPKISLAVMNQPFNVIAPLVFGSLPWAVSDGADPSQRVSADLREIPLDSALAVLTNNMGYQWKRDNGIFVIYRDKEATLQIPKTAAEDNTTPAGGKGCPPTTIQTTISNMLSKNGKLVVNGELGLVWVRDRVDIVNSVATYIKSVNNSRQFQTKPKITISSGTM